MDNLPWPKICRSFLSSLNKPGRGFLLFSLSPDRSYLAICSPIPLVYIFMHNKSVFHIRPFLFSIVKNIQTVLNLRLRNMSLDLWKNNIKISQ